MKPYVFIVILVLALIAVIIFIQRTGPQCSEDAECIPAGCHATQCIPKLAAPNYTETVCTAECVPNTIDCGQGSCVCEKGMCKVKWEK